MAKVGFLRVDLTCSTALAAVLMASAASGQEAASNAATAGGTLSSQPPSWAGVLDEVIVTATKRPEDVRHISASVTALTGDDLEARGAQSFADYLALVPGVAFNGEHPGNSTATIRGVATTVGYDKGQGTTGYFINDVPLTDPVFSVNIPDIDVFDVDNVTVLRGPQGTLFGSASLGGAIDYQAAKPNLNEYQVHVQGLLDGNNSLGGAGKIMVNAPVVSDKLAVRAVYDYREDFGYINNIGTGQSNTNTALIRGGRFEAMWEPESSTTVNYLFLEQDEYSPDAGYTQPLIVGEYDKKTTIAEPTDYGVTINNLRLDQDVGFGTLTATATYHDKTQHIVQDLVPNLGSKVPGVVPNYEDQVGRAYGETFETRLASPLGGAFDYLIGAFYDETHERFHTTFNAVGAAAGLDTTLGAGVGDRITQPGGNIYENDHPHNDGREMAGFGEISYHPASAWKLTFGGRYYDTRIANVTNDVGVEIYSAKTDPSGAELLVGQEHDAGFLPKGAITWTPNGDFMGYALVSTGFRYGGVNPTVAGTAAPIPTTFGPDSLTNYEIGTRTTWLDKRLQLDGTIFDIDWKNVQIREYTTLGASYESNAGDARNYGFEGTGAFAVTHDLTLQATLTYLNAALSENYTPIGHSTVPKGTVLPGAAKWNVTSTIAYRWRKLPFEPTLRLAQRYISQSPSQLGPGTVQGNYDLIDTSVSLDVSKNVLVSVFVHNIGDVRGVTLATNGAAGAFQQYVTEPRTFGITFDFRM
jgi:outer membrane receptor protein involved in Fe transport